jgi:hypothetical protein
MTALIAISLVVLLGVALLVLLSGIALYVRLIKLRTAVTSARSEIDNTLRKRYASPDVRSNTDFQRPQNELWEPEENIAAAARKYNATVRNYNTAIETFPSDLIAKCFSLKKAEFFGKEFS